jgi:hypothetical protein
VVCTGSWEEGPEGIIGQSLAEWLVEERDGCYRKKGETVHILEKRETTVFTLPP